MPVKGVGMQRLVSDDIQQMVHDAFGVVMRGEDLRALKSWALDPDEVEGVHAIDLIDPDTGQVFEVHIPKLDCSRPEHRSVMMRAFRLLGWDLHSEVMVELGADPDYEVAPERGPMSSLAARAYGLALESGQAAQANSAKEDREGAVPFGLQISATGDRLRENYTGKRTPVLRVKSVQRQARR